MVDGVKPELIRVFCPAFTDIFVRRQPPEGFQPLREVISRQESGEMFAELVVAVIVVTPDGCLF